MTTLPTTAAAAVPGHSRLSDAPVAEAALVELCRPFLREAVVPACHVVQPDEIPHPDDALLVHHEHMTVVLEKHHGRPVEVQVLEEHLSGDYYTRKISLTPRGAPTVVEWGIVRMDLRYMDPPVRDEILAKQLPLGAVLIKHNVLRRVKPRFFLQFPPAGPILGLFGRAGAHGSEPLYGRVGTIYCNEEPAIEVMEIVTGIERTAGADGRKNT